jgi:hypothetical protein
MISGNISAVIIYDSQVEDHVQQERKTEEGKIKTVLLRTNQILHCPVDSQNPKRFYQQVEKQEQGQVGDKFSFQKYNLK